MSSPTMLLVSSALLSWRQWETMASNHQRVKRSSYSSAGFLCGSWAVALRGGRCLTRSQTLSLSPTPSFPKRRQTASEGCKAPKTPTAQKQLCFRSRFSATFLFVLRMLLLLANGVPLLELVCSSPSVSERMQAEPDSTPQPQPRHCCPERNTLELQWYGTILAA